MPVLGRKEGGAQSYPDPMTNIVVNWIIPVTDPAGRYIDRERIARVAEKRGGALFGASLISAAAMTTLDGVRASFNYTRREGLDLTVEDFEDLANGPEGFAFDDVRMISPPEHD